MECRPSRARRPAQRVVRLELATRHKTGKGFYQGSAWKVIVPVLIVLFLVIAGLIWLVYKMLLNLF